MFFPFGRSIDARERMLRVAKARLESIAPADEVGFGETASVQPHPSGGDGRHYMP